jgi:hypothetical protein
MLSSAMRERVALGVLAGSAALSATAGAQLRPENVLVLYDSRISDSRLVAEYYAGSDVVPGGAGGRFGTRHGVRALDLATLPSGGFPAAVPTITYAQFDAQLRDPLRAYLTSHGLVHTVRVLVLTKGLPHRLDDTDNPGVGDNAGALVTEFTGRDATCASVDSELSLLWQTLDAGEAGGPADSAADGCIVNPYAYFTRAGLPLGSARALPITAYPTTNILVAKPFRAVFTGSSEGQLLIAAPTPVEQRYLAGDMVLVTRLDAPFLENVYGMLDRSVGTGPGKRIVIDSAVAAAVIDESNSNGVADAAPNAELDNAAAFGSSDAFTRSGDDYELSRDRFLAEGAVRPVRVHYNALAGPDQFIVGPIGDVGEGHGIVVSEPLILLASEGSNHHGGTPGCCSGTLYPYSFNYVPGAVFNSIESFNGRAFNGLGGNGQAQVSDFVRAGGTFGLGNVWEPFTFSIPDNVFLVNNFVQGNLTWVEAAWTSMPVCSWQQLVIGDPLSTVQRTRDDLDGNGSVDVDDLFRWYENPTDVNGDGTVNDTDARVLETSIRGIEATAIFTHQR